MELLLEQSDFQDGTFGQKEKEYDVSSLDFAQIEFAAPDTGNYAYLLAVYLDDKLLVDATIRCQSCQHC